MQNTQTCDRERLAARAPRRPGFSPQRTPSGLCLFSSACPSSGRSGREGSSPGHSPAAVARAPRPQKGPCCSSPGPPPPPSGPVVCVSGPRGASRTCSSTVSGSHCLQDEGLARDTALLKLLPHPLGSRLSCRFWVSRPREPWASALPGGSRWDRGHGCSWSSARALRGLAPSASPAWPPLSRGTLFAAPSFPSSTFRPKTPSRWTPSSHPQTFSS